MAKADKSGAKALPRRAGGKPVAVIDIGSNSIRLVVYDGTRRTPLPLFNEKAICALGEGLEGTGRLNPQGKELAAATLGRYLALVRAMGAAKVAILATAAIRDAADGPAFKRELEAKLGAKIAVLSGEAEAKLSALGVLSGAPEAGGVVADIGGGSLELVGLGRGDFGHWATLPLGVLRLAEASGGDREEATELVDRHLKEAKWLADFKGEPLHAVGGAWRALARIAIAQTGYPLQILDNFALPRAQALQILDLIARMSRRSLEKVGAGVSRRRLPNLPLAAVALARVIARMQPDRVIFSSFGMREGQFYKMLPAAIRKEDPALSACAHLARYTGRFPEHADELMAWMDPLFVKERTAENRLRRAACLLGDTFWNEHPDYRAEHAFHRVLRLPFLGLDHRDRASLALAIHCRYDGPDDADYAAAARLMLDEERERHYRRVGLALRLGHSISGGAPGLLALTGLAIDKGSLILEAPEGHPAFVAEVVERHLDRLARALGLDKAAMRSR